MAHMLRISIVSELVNPQVKYSPYTYVGLMIVSLGWNDVLLEVKGGVGREEDYAFNNNINIAKVTKKD